MTPSWSELQIVMKIAMAKSNQSMRVLLTNAFGLMSKFGEFQHAVLVHKPDIAIVTETKFTQDKISTTESSIPGYSEPVRCDRTAQGGGIAIWCKMGLAVKPLEVDHNVNSELSKDILWCNLRLQTGANLVIGAVYRSGSSADSDITVLEQIDRSLDSFSSTGSQILLAGDFNVHNAEWLGSSKTTRAGERLEEICAEHGLVQHVDEPTRGLNTLDLIISNFPGRVTTQTLSPLGRSDHCVVVADFHDQKLHSEPPSSRRVWRYNKADWHRLRHFLCQTDWSTILTEHPEVACGLLTARIQQGMDQFIPSKHLKIRSSNPVWWTPECSSVTASRGKAWHRTRRYPQRTDLRNAYSEACHRTLCVLNSAEQSYRKAASAKLSNGGLRDKAWWLNVKRAGGDVRSSDIPLLVDSEGHEHVTAQEKADCLGSHFAQKCSVSNDLTADTVPSFPSRCQSTLCRVYFREAAVRKLLQQLDPSKASGPDNISCRVLKECAVELALPLSRLFASCLKHGCQPSSWKVANVVPVHKRGPKSKIKNYRPVSLLSVISKVMESVINHQLMNYLDSHHLLSENQFGFRRRLGTADLLTSLQHEWICTLNHGGIAQILAIDIQGSFDKVSHLGLTTKLASYGIQGHLLEWLKDYLCNRELQAVVSGKTSKRYQVCSGVPQGSILGPTLFLMYINDAEDCLPPQVSLAVYADDTTMYTKIESSASTAGASEALQAGIRLMETWGSKWRVTFEPSKSQLMTVSRKRELPDLPPLMFMGTPVPTAENLKLLGVTFDTKLTFASHLHQISVRARQRLHFLRKVSPLLDCSGRLSVYKGFVRPVMEYGTLAWSGAADTHLNKLDLVQHHAMKIAGPATVLQSLGARRLVGALTYIFKLLCASGPSRLVSMRPPWCLPVADIRTRQQFRAAQHHKHQLLNNLQGDAPDYVRRSFPYGIICYNLRCAYLLLRYHNTLHRNRFIVTCR